tara:strand:+ start:5475 stop:5660 length:186 start_codon:yes stop_codon:yes gene_type:complete
MRDTGSGIAVAFLCVGMLALTSFISAIKDSGKTGEKTDFQYCWESKEKDKCFEQLIKIEGK